jgi:amphi-Trp domain-containing protein
MLHGRSHRERRESERTVRARASGHAHAHANAEDDIDTEDDLKEGENIMSHGRSHRELGRTVRARASMEVEQAADYIETLAKALRAGGVTVRSGTGLVALRTGDRINLDLEAGEEGRQTVVRCGLRWETPVPEERLEIVPGVKQPGAPEPASDAKAGSGQSSATSPPAPASATKR